MLFRIFAVYIKLKALAMAHASEPILDDRELTAEERSLISWMLQNGNLDAPPYLAQLSGARVFSRCPCGCASIDPSV